ncbi:MAG: GerMN domain-containing protein [Desulfobacterales bacterium]|jgi:spore germination protein GerM
MISTAQSKLNRIILMSIGALFIASAACLVSQDAFADKAKKIPKDMPLQTIGSAPSKKSVAHLYFADEDYYYLMSEQRVVTHSDDALDYARSIVEALLKGPQKTLVRTIAADTQLRAIYLVPDGICYVDFSQAVRENHPGGCNSELLTIYSVVNSLILNVPEVKRVKLLIDGNEVQTLAGHIDLVYPLEANMLLIR